MNSAISLENIGKKYRLGVTPQRYKALRDILAGWIAHPLRSIAGARSQNSRSEFWALRNISFDIPPGQVVGVIGRNGAGKSTLLKILSRITDPTEGRARLYGRVGSLLEVGSGFHPELTGRENIFLNGSIIGMKKGEILRKFDEIVAFAEVEKFIDTAVKHYSSGMYLRLAFAVAAHLDTEILFVDEVLAVGDAAFQRKCLGKMSEVSRNGRTVLFVSHNMMAVQTLCDRGLWFSQGQLVMDDDAQTVVSKYLQSGAQSLTEQYWTDPAEAPGNEFIKLSRLRIVAENPAYITVYDDFELECAYWNQAAGARINLSLHVYTIEGVCVFASISDSVPHHAGLVVETCRIPGRLLNDGVYRCRMMFVRDMSHVLFDYQNAALFEIFEGPRDATWYGKMPGVVRPQLAWKAADVTERLPVDGIPLGAERG